MAKIESVAAAVREHWISKGLRVSDVQPEELTQLKESRKEEFPAEYESFLRIAGLPEDEDERGFRFWLPREVRTSLDVLGDAGYDHEGSKSSLVIADYLQESWWYALSLSGPLAGLVSLVLGGESGKDPQLQPPLGTVAEFLLAYLQDDSRLYPPASDGGQ